jgi:hypothetical protein
MSELHVTLEEKLEKATQWLRDADGFLVTGGTGMGVDSGLPDFRGADGFWRAYPALLHHGLSFEDMANPATFANDPILAWGFYWHCLALSEDRTACRIRHPPKVGRPHAPRRLGVHKQRRRPV